MDETLIISSNDAHGKYLPTLLARKLEKNDIPVLLSSVCWPRDEFFFYPDGKCDYVQKGTCQPDFQPHFAWNGGTYLEGNNFIIASLTANPESKQKATHNVLGVENGFYFDISEELDSLSHIKVNGKRELFSSEFPHIDLVYNICNAAQTLLTYNHPKLIEKGVDMAHKTNYSLQTIPLEEAVYASIGFVEFGEKIILDKRAKKTKNILKDIGYDVITTPFALKKTNSYGGSLRCMTQEIPIPLERIVLKRPEDYSFVGRNFMYNTKGQTIKTESGYSFELN